MRPCSILLAAALGLLALPALADGWVGPECETTADCPTAFTCQEVELDCGDGQSCPPCACPDCDPDDPECDADCECPPCDEPEPCEPGVVLACVFTPAACIVTNDCPVGFVCLDQEVCADAGGCACTDCVCPDCPDGEQCPECDCPEEPVCECEDEEPECESLGALCVPDQIACEVANDCPADWTCTEFATPCACPGCDSRDGEDCPPCDCEDETESYCLPGGWEDLGFDEGEALGGEDFVDAAVDEEGDDQDHGGGDADADVDGEVDGDGDADGEPRDPEGTAADGEGDSSLECGVTGGSGSLLALLLLGLASRRQGR